MRGSDSAEATPWQGVQAEVVVSIIRRSPWAVASACCCRNSLGSDDTPSAISTTVMLPTVVTVLVVEGGGAEEAELEGSSSIVGATALVGSAAGSLGEELPT